MLDVTIATDAIVTATLNVLFMAGFISFAATTEARSRRTPPTSIRTLNRQFRDQVGTTPIAWLAATRIRRAQHLLEVSDASIEHIAIAVGFRSTNTLREHFVRLVGTSPIRYRQSFTPAQQSA